MIFYVIFGDFVGWDWGTPAILQQKHPWKIGSKFGIGRPPPSVGTKSQIFPMSLFEGSPYPTVMVEKLYHFMPNSVIETEMSRIEIINLLFVFLRFISGSRGTRQPKCLRY